MQRGVPLPTDVPIVESRKRPAKERGNQLSRPRCHQEIPEITHREVSSVHLSENQITICHLFLPPQRQFLGKRGRTSTAIRGETRARKFRWKTICHLKVKRCWVRLEELRLTPLRKITYEPCRTSTSSIPSKAKVKLPPRRCVGLRIKPTRRREVHRTWDAATQRRRSDQTCGARKRKPRKWSRSMTSSQQRTPREVCLRALPRTLNGFWNISSWVSVPLAQPRDKIRKKLYVS